MSPMHTIFFNPNPKLLETILSNPNFLNSIHQRDVNFGNMFQPVDSTPLTQEQTETKNKILDKFRDPSFLLDRPDIVISEEEMKAGISSVSTMLQQFVHNQQGSVISNILQFLADNPDPQQTGISQETRNGLQRLYIDKDTMIECSICLSTQKSRIFIKLKCGHLFDKDCILTWLSQRKTCPMCRSSDLI
jgi:hypothetical protein